jgi:hypothetical protein
MIGLRIGYELSMVRSPGVVAHTGVAGPAAFIAVGLFFFASGASYAAYRLFIHPSDALRRAAAISLGVVAFGCFGVATTLPFFLGARPSLGRPSTTAQLEIVSPRAGEVFRGDPASVPVALQLEGGRIVPISSLRLVPNQGHIHMYLDGSLVSMTSGLDATVNASPGQHQLQVEFVAIDHAPFQPRVQAAVTFFVRR